MYTILCDASAADDIFAVCDTSSNTTWSNPTWSMATWSNGHYVVATIGRCDVMLNGHLVEGTLSRLDITSTAT